MILRVFITAACLVTAVAIFIIAQQQSEITRLRKDVQSPQEERDSDLGVENAPLPNLIVPSIQTESSPDAPSRELLRLRGEVARLHLDLEDAPNPLHFSLEDQSEWQRCDFVKDMGFAMEMERAMTLDFYSQIRQSKQKLNFVIGQHLKTEEMSDGAFGKLPTHGFVLNWLHLPVWRIAWLAQDELASLEQWDFMIEHERIARTNGWAALAAIGDEPKLHWRLAPEAKDSLGWYDRMRFLFASENFSITDVLVRRALERQTEQQMAVTVLGIRRYKLRNGRLPIALSELIPDYLAAMPHDFMDGKALRYRIRPGGKDFELYSVGEDGKDNGGDPDQNKEKKSYRQIWDGRDALWPSAATAAESKLAVSTTKHE